MKKTFFNQSYWLVVVFLSIVCLSCDKDTLLVENSEQMTTEELKQNSYGTCLCPVCTHPSTCTCPNNSMNCTNPSCIGFGEGGGSDEPCEGCETITLDSRTAYPKMAFLQCIQFILHSRYGIEDITIEELEIIVEKRLYVYPRWGADGVYYYARTKDILTNQFVSTENLVLEYFFIVNYLSGDTSSIIDALDSNLSYVFAFRNGGSHPIVIKCYNDSYAWGFYDPREGDVSRAVNTQTPVHIVAVKKFPRLRYLNYWWGDNAWYDTW